MELVTTSFESSDCRLEKILTFQLAELIQRTRFVKAM